MTQNTPHAIRPFTDLLRELNKVKDDAIESFRKDYAEKTGISVLRSPKLARFIG